MPEPTPHPAQRIIETVLELLEAGGYDGIQVRDVARRARIGLGTIYKLFSSREDLILSAIEHWMDTHTFAELAAPTPDESLYEGLMRVQRDVFEPWERQPWMLDAYHRARGGPGGERLQLKSVQAIAPLASAVLQRGDPQYIRDVEVVLTNVTHGAIARFVARELDITELLPTIERAVYRLTVNNEPFARQARPRRPRAGRQ